MFILGGHQTDFARNWGLEDLGLYDMMAEAVQGALSSAQLEASEVQVAHVGNFVGELFTGQGHLGGQFAAIDPAFDGVAASRHEAACASGSMAVLAAYADLAAGLYDVACVVGVEQMRNVRGQEAADHLGAALWRGQEAQDARFPWPYQFSQISEAYAERYGLKPEHLIAIAQKNYDHAKHSEVSQTRAWSFPDEAFTVDDVHNPVIEGNVRKMDCSRITDGAACVILASERYASRWAASRDRSLDEVPKITGFGHRTSRMKLADKLEASKDQPGLMFPHLAGAIRDAWSRAGVAGPDDLDAVETHDCFTITEYLAMDHFGLTAPGEAWRAIEEEQTRLGGKLPFNTTGGLIGGGHPVGATGVRMLWDAARQVSGTAGAAQVEGTRTAQTLNIGGSATTVASFVVQR